MTRLRRTAFALLLLLSLSACGTQGLNFVQDERLEIVAPKDREKVALPVTVQWQVTDFEITGPGGRPTPDAGYFGVYIDRAPQPPEKDQSWLVRDDQACRQLPTSCQAEGFLSDRHIYSTSETSFVIERLPQPSSEAQRRREFHEVTIVLLDGEGKRIGESAFIRQFEVDRTGGTV